MATTVRVTDEALERLREAVFAKHRSLRGHLRDEATEALRRHADRLEAEHAEGGR